MANLATNIGSPARPGVQLDVENLMERARRATGLSDFGDMWFVKPLTSLVGFVNREAGLPSTEVASVRRIVHMLSDRLKLMDFIKRNPDVSNEEVHVAGIIVAHARGGSTLTQRLMGRSPQLNATYFWELHTPVPLPGEAFGDPSGRIKMGDDEVAAWAKAIPEHGSMHPHNSQYHEEDLVLGDRGFISYMYSGQFNIPSYHAWMVAEDETKSYEEIKRWLQVLQYKQPLRQGKKWLLKSCHHFISQKLRTMFKTFPDTTAIITHRRMEEVIPSHCSVTSAHIRSFSGSESFDPTEMGDRLSAQYLPAVRDLMAVRREMAPDKFVDIHYRQTLTDPIGQFRRIMEGIGLSVTTEDVNQAFTWMAQNGRGTHPPHIYKPEDFGVTKGQLESTFKFYHDAFDIR